MGEAGGGERGAPSHGSAVRGEKGKRAKECRRGGRSKVLGACPVVYGWGVLWPWGRVPATKAPRRWYRGVITVAGNGVSMGGEVCVCVCRGGLEKIFYPEAGLSVFACDVARVLGGRVRHRAPVRIVERQGELREHRPVPRRQVAVDALPRRGVAHGACETARHRARTPRNSHCHFKGWRCGENLSL